jgi:tRNA-specific adenosine deaminase 1
MYQHNSLSGGDASMTFLASSQDSKMKQLKDSHPKSTQVPPVTRGRDNYSLCSVLRTKPGRADSPPTSSLSCSDKIAKWSVLGFQGALLSRILDPVYIDEIIIDDTGVPVTLRDLVQSDCERAFGGRIESLAQRCPVVKFQNCPFTPPMTCPDSSHEGNVFINKPWG